MWYQRMSEMTYLPLIVGEVLNLTTSEYTLSALVILAIHASVQLVYALARSLWAGRVPDYEKLIKSGSIISQFQKHLYDLSQEVLDPDHFDDIVQLISNFDPSFSRHTRPTF